MLYERGLFGFFKGIPYTPKKLTINFWIVLPCDQHHAMSLLNVDSSIGLDEEGDAQVLKLI